MTTEVKKMDVNDGTSQWLVTGLVPQKGAEAKGATTFLLHGSVFKYEHYATHFGLQLAHAVATGAKFLSSRVTQPVPVLYVRFENDHVKDYVEEHYLSCPDVRHVEWSQDKFDTPEGRSALAKLAKSTGVGMIIIDHMEAAFNHPKDMEAFKQNLLDLINAVQVPIVFLHRLPASVVSGGTRAYSMVEPILSACNVIELYATPGPFDYFWASSTTQKEYIHYDHIECEFRSCRTSWYIVQD